MAVEKVSVQKILPDPERWAVEVYGLEKRFVRRQGLPGDTSVGSFQWLYSTLLKYRNKPEFVRALNGVDLRVARGEVLGLLGPNGAGKTTLIKCLATLLKLDGGEAYVNGYNVRTQPDEVRLSINLVGSGHWVGFDWGLTIEQNLHFFGSLYGLSRSERQERIDQTLGRLGLEEYRRATPDVLSAGQRQRMLLAKGFMVRTPVFFLDEPTVGLDPEGARDVREFIRTQLIGHTGTSAILTTHRMNEAEALCGRIAIMDRGKVVAHGTPLELRRLAGERSVLEIHTRPVPLAALAAVREIGGVLTAAVSPVGGEGLEESLRVHCEDVDRTCESVIATLKDHGVNVLSLEQQETTLEDAFIGITGRRLES